MNPFERARIEALRVRSELLKHCSNTCPSSAELLAAVEDSLQLAIERVAHTFSALGGGEAVLKREEQSIYVRDDVNPVEYSYLVAHELGHWILDAERSDVTVSALSSLTKSDGTPATLKVEAYGVRERQELQANVFARELLLPRNVAKQLWDSGRGAAEISNLLSIPLEVSRQQLLDAVLLPQLPESPPIAAPTPSPDQTKAATATERFVNVVAGPGTGKTTTLVQRVRHLIETEKVAPNRILVLTFTNKAAFELVERLRASGLKSAGDIWAGTFHALGLEFFRKYHQLFNLDPDVRVADTLQEISLLVKKLPLLTLKFYQRLQDPYEWLKDVVDCIHRLKEELIDPTQFRQRVNQFHEESDELKQQREDIANLYDALENSLNEARMVSMSDLVMRTAITLRDNRSGVSQLANHFEHVLVDEYQDVSESMVVLVRQLANNARSLWVVGDVRQAIHHWRGASVKSLLKFEQSFRYDQSQTAKKYALDANRRSSSEIVTLFSHVGRQHVLEQQLPLDPLTAVNGLAGSIPELVSCSNRGAVAPAILQKINLDKTAGVEYRDQAVLCRRAADVEYIASYLRQAGIPIFYIGDLMRRTEVKRFLCLMQLLVEREPKALIGLSAEIGLQLPISDIQHLINQARNFREFQRGRWLGKSPGGLSTAGISATTNLAHLLRGFTWESSPWTFLCDLLLERRFGLPNPADNSIEAQTQRIAIWQLAYSIRNDDGDGRRVNLSRYLRRQQLQQRIGDTHGDRQLPTEANAMNAVRILTVHGSKGLEFGSVHLGYVDSGSFGAKKPTWNLPDSIEDVLAPEILGSTAEEFEFENAVERNNLLYVALSRAKTRLHIYENVEFGTKERPPQLCGLSNKLFQINAFNLPTTTAPSGITVKASSQLSITFDEFEAYVRCPRQYYYRYKLKLVPEQELDVSFRARRAIGQTLIAFAKGGQPNQSFEAAWIAHKLPAYAEDQGLYNDAVTTCNRGLALIDSLKGTVVEGATARLAGLHVQLPWVIHAPQVGVHLIRLSSRGATKTRDLLRPLILDASRLPQTTFTLSTLLVQRSLPVELSKAPDKTAAYKSSVRLLANDYSPTPSAICGKCAFSSICPSLPKA